MNGLALSHLPADFLGLADWAREALAKRPLPPNLPGMILPETLDSVPLLRASGEPFTIDAREELTAALEAGISKREPHIRVLESVRALGTDGAAIVIAGQQPGFLGGPLYNIYKCIHAIRLASALTEKWGVPVLPAFWNHADDHDIAEVHHLWIQNPNLDLRKVSMAGMSSGRTPLSDVVFESDTHQLIGTRELLRQNLRKGEEQGPAIDLFMPRDGETFAGAFTRVLLELFGHHGLIVIEPDWIREQLSRSLAHVVTADVAASLTKGSELLQAAGNQPAIDPTTAALVFHLENGERRALRLAHDGYRYDEEPGSRTPAELAAQIVQDPSSWSPGALLRPLVQDRTLPVVAYVGGWGELAYHAQLPPLRDSARVARTAFVPRLSATLVDDATASSLEKLNVDVRDVIEAKGKLGEGEQPETTVNEVSKRLRAIADGLKQDLFAEREALSEVDRGLSGQLKKVAGQATAGIEKLAVKVDRVVANAEGRGQRHHRRLNNSLFPRATPQERIQGSLEVIARHGRDWIDELEREVEPLPTEHLVVTLKTGDTT